MTNIDGDSNAIVSTNVVEIDTHGFEDIEIRNSNLMVTGIDNNYDVQVENLDELDITVAKKEYTITGDDIYIPQFYDDAPQWMKDLVSLVVDVSMSTNNMTLINDMNKMLQEFAVSYVPLNQYTQSILDLGNEDIRLNAVLETLNSNFNIGLSKANAQIISLQMTKASKDEVVAQVIQTLAAQLSNPNSNLGATVGRLDQAIVTEQTARATSFRALTASLESIDGSIAANAEILDSALAYVGIDEAGASTGTGLSAYLEASDGTIGGADSQLANTIRVTAEGVESKWSYNSIVNINGVYRKSGFGLTTNNFSGGGTQANPYNSEFWIDATKLRFTNSNMTGRTAPFTIDASGTTPQIKFNGVVEFSNVNGASQGVVSQINNGQTTTINGGKITTGSITAAQIAASTITANEIATKGITADKIGSTTGNSTVWYGGGLVSANFNGNAHGNIGSPTNGFRLSSNAAGTSTDPNIYGAYIKASIIENLYAGAPGTSNYGNFNYTAYGSTVGVVGINYSTGYRKNRVISLSNSVVVVKGFLNISTGEVSNWDISGTLQRSLNSQAYTTIQTKRVYFNLPTQSASDSAHYSIDVSVNVTVWVDGKYGSGSGSGRDSGFISVSISITPKMAMTTTLEFYYVENLPSLGDFQTIDYRIPSGTVFLTLNN